MWQTLGLKPKHRSQMQSGQPSLKGEDGSAPAVKSMVGRGRGLFACSMSAWHACQTPTTSGGSVGEHYHVPQVSVMMHSRWGAKTFELS